VVAANAKDIPVTQSEIEENKAVGSGSMTELTKALTKIVNGTGEGAPLVLNLDGRADEEPWPGPVESAEVNRWERVLRQLESVPVPTIAVLGGVCRGAALEIALACDFRVAAPGTTLRFDPQPSVWPSMALFRVVRIAGLQPARRLALWRGALAGPQALEAGLIDVVSEPADGALQAMVAEIGEVADARVTRQLLHEAVFTGFDDALGAHLAASDRHLRRLGNPISA
jgi:isomerase DpgB